MSKPPLETEKDDVKTLLKALFIDGLEWTKNRSAKSNPSFSSLSGKLILKEEDFDAHVSNKNWFGAGEFTNQKFLLIRSDKKDKHATSAIWCRWDFEKTPIKFGCYLGIWSQFKTDIPNAAPLKFSGSRYETPQAEGHEHRFHHLQPCQSMGSKNDEPIRLAVPVNPRYPTVALPANKPSEMLLCLALSVYRAEELAGLKHILDTHPRLNRQTSLRNLFDRWLEQVPNPQKAGSRVWQTKQRRFDALECEQSNLNFGV